MAARLYLIAGKVTDSVTDGFLPAAGRLGLDVTVLTDRAAEHETAYAGTAPSAAPTEIIECDVTDFRAIVSTVARTSTRTHAADAIFSNSDHLQTQTALAAAYFGLAAKDWRAALHTKNKALMRTRLNSLGLDSVRFAVLEPGTDPAALPAPYAAEFPVVIKPREGVASEDVVLVHDRAELVTRCHQIRRRRPGAALLVEEYLAGPLYTMETLGDGQNTAVLGSFATTLSNPPYFVEHRLEWTPRLPPAVTGQVLDQLAALGVGFGACHTEFVVDEGVAGGSAHRGAGGAGGVGAENGAAKARLVEVNYRIIGDHCDFLLGDLLDVPIFEYVLRVHLGEPLDWPVDAGLPHEPAGSRWSGRSYGHAIVEAVIADRSGVLTAAPGPLDLRTPDGVRLTYRPVRNVGDMIAVTNTNRDYLGSIRVIGPDQERVEAASRHFRATHHWEISP